MGGQIPEGSEVGIKEVGPIRVASVQHSGPYEDIGRVLMDLFRWVLINGGKVASYPMAILPLESQVDPKEQLTFEACIPVAFDTPVKGDSQVKIREIKAAKVAFIQHSGSFSTIDDSYDRVLGWIKDNGYQVAGPGRELYLTNPTEHSDEDLRTEIQIPVEAVRH